MNKTAKVILGLSGSFIVGITTYYIVTNDRASATIEKPITNPEKDTLALVKVPVLSAKEAESKKIVEVSNALGIDGKDFKPTKDEGVYINSTNDKLLVIKEDVWKLLISKVQKKFPKLAEDCLFKRPVDGLSDYEFVGLLTHFSDSKKSAITVAYEATEIKRGNARTFAGGNICCDCEGESLVPQQMDAIIIK